MKYCYLLFILFNVFSICFNTQPEQQDKENKILTIANRYIDFTGSASTSCRVNTINKVNYIYLALYFNAEITGFTRAYSFRMYLTDPSYAYMICTVPASTTDPSSYVECRLDIEKFYLISWTVNLPNSFPELDDCQVSYWEKVTKSIFTTCTPEYHLRFRPSTITGPLCYSSTQNFIEASGALLIHTYSHESFSDFDLTIPVLIDDKETNVSCTIYNIEGENWGYKCIFPGKNKLQHFDTVATKSHTKIWIQITKEFKLMDCQNPDRLIKFVSASSQCTYAYSKKALVVFFNAYIFGFAQQENFILNLNSPSYANLNCTIPKSLISSSEKQIICILDINKYPLYSNRKITLPSQFPDISSEINNWNNINKEINTGVCYPSIAGTIYPEIVHDPTCIKDDYNLLTIYTTIDFSKPSNYNWFNLNVLIDGKNDAIHCEFITQYTFDDAYYPIYCFSNSGNTNITFFETTLVLSYTKTVIINFNPSKNIKLNICSLTEKVIFFTNIEFLCSGYNTNQKEAEALLFAKTNGFKSTYKFNISLDDPPYYYMTCTVPASKTGVEVRTMNCLLDLYKFPLIDPSIMTLPSKISLPNIQIFNWDKMIKQYNGTYCNYEYSLEFLPKEYIETSCYKPYYNKLSVIGQIEHKDDYYSFEMNAIVDNQIQLLPCEFQYLGGNSNDYQLNCITNGKNSVSFFNTFARDDKTEELIYTQISHQFTIKECLPSKYIEFTKIKSECSTNESLFKIYFYANIKGFSSVEKISVNLKQPEYARMDCTIPKSEESSEQYILCTIDVNRYPFVSVDEITLPTEFYIHPEWDIINWEKISKQISTEKCSSTSQYTFKAIKYYETECYLKGYNSFIAEGTFESNNNANVNNFNIHKITLDTYVNSDYKTISCEIYPPDISREYSRIYCYSTEMNIVKIFPTIAQSENSNEKIFINIDHTYDIKDCPEQNKMIYIKTIESECSLNESILKILIYSDIVGYNTEEKITINLKDPSPSYMECTIPKTNSKEYIKCSLDIYKFPLVSKNTIILPDSFSKISNWNNINKELTTGKCHLDYSLVFYPSKLYEAKCYEKNNNVVALLGSLNIQGKGTSDVSKMYKFTLNSIVDGNYTNILCEIYPPDASFSEHRMFCNTNKRNSIKMFQTMVSVIDSHETIYLNITNYNFNLRDCSADNKTIYFKGIDLKYTESFVDINFYGKISGATKEATFSIIPEEPNYSYITCLLPFSENIYEDIIIQCKYDIEKFPLVKTDKIKFQNSFPKVKDFSISNWDLFDKYLYIGNQHQNYSISFIAYEYIDAICYETGYNAFSAIGFISLNDNNIKNRIFEFNNYAIIDGEYSIISCKIYPIDPIDIINSDYQMDCYTKGSLTGVIFPVIVPEKNTNKRIFIDSINKYTLQNCQYQIIRTIDFQGNTQQQCIENESSFIITFSAKTFGFTKTENIDFKVYNSNDKYYMKMNCIIPISRNGEDMATIKCTLDTKKFPIINTNEIILPLTFPWIENCETSNWSKITKTFSIEQCYQPYQIKFSNFRNNEINCKSKNEAIVSIIGSLQNIDETPISYQEIHEFKLPVISDNDIIETSCELYKPYGNFLDYYQMDCNFTVEEEFRIYRTIVQDKISQKFIYIDQSLYNIYINRCSNYNKFINFDGNLEIRYFSDFSLLQLLLYSQTIGFKKEEKFKLNLTSPVYSYIDCVIPSSNSKNGSFVDCKLDTNKFPLTKEDYMLLPFELKVEDYSITKWKKIKKELKNNDFTPNHTYIFYSYDEQNIDVKCDNNGNNIITISGALDSNKTKSQHNFDIFGIVDSKYKSINCNLDIKGEINQIICRAKGQNSSLIFQTMGIDTKGEDNILIKVNDYIEYNLIKCDIPSKLSTFNIILISGSCLIFLIIVIAVFLIIRKKRREAKPDTKINSLIKELGELQEN